MKKIILFLLALLMVFTFTSCGKKTLKIGFIGPLTGDYANYGKLMSQAVAIAVEEKNAQGGIDGIEIQLVKEDSEGNPDKANLAIEKLASVDKIWGMIGCIFSGTSLAIAPKCQSASIPMISPSATHKDLPGKGSFIFRTVLSDAFQAIVFAKYVYREMGLRRIAILHIKNDYSQGLAEDFKRVFEEEGGTITIVESAVQGDNDFKTQLTKIKGTDSEALFLPSYIADIAQGLEQAKQLGLDMQMLSADGFTNPEIFELAGELANGVVYSAPEASHSNLKTNFEKLYEEKYGEKPDSFSLNAYDGARILLSALERAYNEASADDKAKLALDRDLIQKYIAATKDFDGVSGKITFLPNGDASKNVGISISENKQYKQLNVYKLEGSDIVEIK